MDERLISYLDTLITKLEYISLNNEVEYYTKLSLDTLTSASKKRNLSPLVSLTNELYDRLQHSCIVPFMAKYIANDSLLDMGRHAQLYQKIFVLIQVLLDSNYHFL